MKTNSGRGGNANDGRWVSNYNRLEIDYWAHDKFKLSPICHAACMSFIEGGSPLLSSRFIVTNKN